MTYEDLVSLIRCKLESSTTDKSYANIPTKRLYAVASQFDVACGDLTIQMRKAFATGEVCLSGDGKFLLPTELTAKRSTEDVERVAHLTHTLFEVAKSDREQLGINDGVRPLME